MGAWTIGRRIPSRSQSGVCNLVISRVFSALVSDHFMPLTADAISGINNEPMN